MPLCNSENEPSAAVLNLFNYFDEAERNASDQLLQEYLVSRSPLSHHSLRLSLPGKGKLLQELRRKRILLLWTGDSYIPGLAAFVISPDEELRRIGLRSAETILSALHSLYRERGAVEFSKSEIVNEALKINPAFANGPGNLDLGLLLMQDFSKFYGGHRTASDGVASVTIKDDIADFTSFGEALHDEANARRIDEIRHEQGKQGEELAAVFGRSNDIPEATPARDFSFIQNESLRAIVERDYSELGVLKGAGVTKAILLLCGSIIEALLLDQILSRRAEALAASRAPRKKEPDEWHLYELVDVAVEIKVLHSDSKDIVTVAREYRNLIHPGREMKSDRPPDHNEASIAEKVVAIVVRDLSAKNQRTTVAQKGLGC